MNVNLSKLALGSVQFGLDYGINNSSGKVDVEEVGKIIDVAFSYNINTIDTACAYGNAETVLGLFNLEKWKIISKFNFLNNEASIEKELELSLSKLKQKYLYGYIAHSANFFIENPNQWKQIKSLKEKGKIGRVGFSIYKTEQLDKLIELGCLPEIIQVQYNIFDRRFEPYFEYLKSIDCEIHTRSAFLQGLFFKKNIIDFFNPIKNEIEKIQEIFTLESERAAFLLSFCLNNKYIDKVVMGVQSAKELHQNLNALLSFDSLKDSSVSIPETLSELLLPYNWPKN